MSWFAVHWPWATAAGTTVGAVIGWFMHLWRSKEEIGKIRDERDKMRKEASEMKHRLDVLSCAELIHFMAHQIKIAEGTHDVLFSEEQMYEWAEKPKWGIYVHPALQLLKEKGLAVESTIPGCYYIDRPKFSGD
jgi:hypothetical protein